MANYLRRLLDALDTPSRNPLDGMEEKLSAHLMGELKNVPPPLPPKLMGVDTSRMLEKTEEGLASAKARLGKIDEEIARLQGERQKTLTAIQAGTAALDILRMKEKPSVPLARHVLPKADDIGPVPTGLSDIMPKSARLGDIGDTGVITSDELLRRTDGAKSAVAEKGSGRLA